MSLKSLREASKEFDSYSKFEMDLIMNKIRANPLDTTLREYPKIAKILSWALQIVSIFPIGSALKLIFSGLVIVLEGIANEKMKQ